MKLYHAITIYHLINIISMSIENDEKADILISPWLESKIVNKKVLNQFFDNIYVYTCDLKEKDNINDNIIKFFDTYNKKNKININKYDEFIIAGIQYYFGQYLCLINKKITILEESDGMLSRPEIIYKLDANFDEIRSKNAKKLGLFDGSNKNITKIYCNFDSQKENFMLLNTCKNYEICEVLKKLDENSISRILSLFEINKIEIDPDTTLLLTQQFANLKILSFKEQINIYKIFIDMFLKDEKIIIKKHPDDFLYYKDLFENVSVIKSNFPSELIPIIFNNIPNKIATISSTGINQLKSIFDETVYLGYDFEKNYLEMFKYYEIFKFIQNFNIEEVCVSNMNLNILDSLKTKYKSEIIFNKNFNNDIKLLIVGNINNENEYNNLLEIIKENKDLLIIFANLNNNYDFYKIFKENYNDFLTKKIVKIDNKNKEHYLNMNNERIYFYTKNKELKSMIKDYESETKLSNSGIDLLISKNDSEKDLEIEKLKALLEATEKRLLYYINKENEK